MYSGVGGGWYISSSSVKLVEHVKVLHVSGNDVCQSRCHKVSLCILINILQCYHWYRLLRLSYARKNPSLKQHGSSCDCRISQLCKCPSLLLCLPQHREQGFFLIFVRYALLQNGNPNCKRRCPRGSKEDAGFNVSPFEPELFPLSSYHCQQALLQSGFTFISWGFSSRSSH